MDAHEIGAIIIWSMIHPFSGPATDGQGFFPTVSFVMNATHDLDIVMFSRESEGDRSFEYLEEMFALIIVGRKSL